jgi:hypothetical protein
MYLITLYSLQPSGFVIVPYEYRWLTSVLQVKDRRWHRSLLPQSATPAGMGYHPNKYSNIGAQDQFMPSYDPTNVAFFEAHLPPPISPFVSLDLGNIEAYCSFEYVATEARFKF